MANGEFLRGLSSGIFGELSRQDAEQKAKDKETKLGLIKLYSDMANHIEPEGLPVLMGELGKVLEVKGKMKGLWNALSGMPDRSIEDQLGTQIRELPGMLVGPETARKARAGGDMARLFQPQTPEQQANQQSRLNDERGLQGKMIFRDPRREKLEEIESRYGAQLAQNLQLKEIEHQNQLNKLAETYRLKGTQDQTRYNQKIFLARDKVAEDFLGSGKARSLPEAQQMASTYLQDKSEAELDNINALVGLRGALKTKAQAEAKAIGPGGLKPTDIDRRTKNFLTAQEKLSKFEGTSKGIREQMTNKLGEIDTIINQFPNYKFKFNPDTGATEILQAPPDVKPGDVRYYTSHVALKAEKPIAEYNKLKKELQAAEAEAGGYKKSVEEYQKYKPTSKATPPQKPQKPLPRVGIGTTGVRVSKEQGDQSGYTPGMTVRIGPKSYKVEGLRNGWWILRPITKE